MFNEWWSVRPQKSWKKIDARDLKPATFDSQQVIAPPSLQNLHACCDLGILDCELRAWKSLDIGQYFTTSFARS